jgi:hypothetical protein
MVAAVYVICLLWQLGRRLFVSLVLSGEIFQSFGGGKFSWKNWRFSLDALDCRRNDCRTYHIW